MTWMLTNTGAAVDLRLMAPETISALDIGAALAYINRFTGHASRAYSVAEHSLHVVTVMERELNVRDPAVLFAGLMHDAHEAYTGDLHTPLKQMLGPAWAETEHRIQAQVLRRFGAFATYMRHRITIKLADLTMLATERRDLLPASGPQWDSLTGIDPLPHFNLHEFGAMDAADWREAFLERFSELYQAART